MLKTHLLFYLHNLLWAHNPFLIHSEPNKNEYQSLNKRASVQIPESGTWSSEKSLQSHRGIWESPQRIGGSHTGRSGQTLSNVLQKKNKPAGLNENTPS